jgi:hypothetical protein
VDHIFLTIIAIALIFLFLFLIDIHFGKKRTVQASITNLKTTENASPSPLMGSRLSVNHHATLDTTEYCPGVPGILRCEITQQQKEKLFLGQIVTVEISFGLWRHDRIHNCKLIDNE